MTDLREYKDIIKRAVAIERLSDKNWTWRIKSIAKSIVRIAWSYMESVGEKDAAFTLRVMGGETAQTVIATAPDGHQKFVLIGTDRWCDAPTLERGLAMAVKAIAAYAHSVY